MMALTEQDRDWVQLTARELTYEVIKGVLAEHVKNCPHGQKQLTYKNIIVGVVIGASFFGGLSGAGFAVVKLLLGI